MKGTRKVRMTELFHQWERQAAAVCRLEILEDEDIPRGDVGAHNDTVIRLVGERCEIETAIAKTLGGTPLDALCKLKIALYRAERSEVADWKPSADPAWRLVASALQDLQAAAAAAGQAPSVVPRSPSEVPEPGRTLPGPSGWPRPVSAPS